MANILDYARQGRGFGQAEPNAVEKQKAAAWQNALQAASLAALAKGADTKTMLGFAVGKWLSNYLDRGREKDIRKNDDELYRQAMGYGVPQGGAQSNPNGYYADSDNGLAVLQGGLLDDNSMKSLLEDYYKGKNGSIFAG